MAAYGVIHALRIDESEDFVRHLGEKFVYVLRRTTEVHFETRRGFGWRRGMRLTSIAATATLT
jgi:hypothetical protein